MNRTTPAPLFPELEHAFARAFGKDEDPIEQVAERAAGLLPDHDVVVWEGDPATFEFTYVSPSAERVFGYPASEWKRDGFWAQAILHGEDRRDAIAYCALATAQCRDHQFEYRGRRKDGQVRWIYDVVKVIRGPKGVPVKLRGVMLDITDRKRAEGTFGSRAERRYPKLEDAAAAP
jgi:PAS domain S-box-containing protein